MASLLADHQAIRSVKTFSGNTPNTKGIGELAGQTFLAGVPVQISAGGFIQIWDGATLVAGIAGITLIQGSNYATNAQGAPQPFLPVSGTAALQTFGKVQNQPAAVNIAPGTPFVDGRTLFEVASDDTVFEAQVDNSGGGATLLAQNMVGAKFGLTFDATGHCYVDVSKTAANAAVRILALNPNDAIGTPNGRVWFTILQATAQLAN